ncbi:hypothetical protein AYI69_g7036 [Smittium culicis]|uniref:Uncharacterized protein n=1 Tax=Smittium culicis TaxID=133412 RepID=A0A1R1XUT5_9FUNG|nr:hypothetical protein AYI69_g7036 [Smittium culicis]
MNPSDSLSRMSEDISEIDEDKIELNSMDIITYNHIKQYIMLNEYPENSDEELRRKIRNKSKQYYVFNKTLFKKVKGLFKEVLN